MEGPKVSPAKTFNRSPASRSWLGRSRRPGAAKRVNRVAVSTDDAEIAAVARRFGAEVVDRPESISGDAASSESALLHALDSLERSEGYEPDIVVFLQCTSPLTASEDIDGAIEAMERQGADTAVAVVPFHYFLWRRDDSGDGLGINHDKRVRLLRQDREPQYLESGAIYVMKTDGFRAARHRFFGKTSLYEMPGDDAAGRSTIRSTCGSRKSCSDPAGKPIIEPLCLIDSTRLFSTSTAFLPTTTSLCWKKDARPLSVAGETVWASNSCAGPAGRWS